MKYLHHKIAVCAALVSMPMAMNAQTEQSAEAVVAEADSSVHMVNVAFRQVAQQDLLGGVSTINVEELIKSNYTLGALENTVSLVGGWNGSTLWGMDQFTSNYFILIDGVPRDLGNLIASEIEQITFLKSADAVALYGSRGSKGAILITTKRGKVSDGLQIELRGNTGFYVAKSYPEWLSSPEYMMYYNQALKNDGKDPMYSEEDIYNYASGKNPYRYPNIDYYSSDYITKWYNRSDVGAEISGGNEKARFYSSINWYTNGDYMNFAKAKDNRTNRYSIRGNVDIFFNEYIKAYIDGNATYYDAKSTAGSWWRAANNERPNRPVNAAPLIPTDLIDPSASGAWNLIGATNNVYDGMFLAGTTDDQTNVFADIYAGGKNNTTIRKFQFDAGLMFDLKKVLEGLSFKTVLAMDFATSYNTNISNKYSVFVPEWGSYNGKEYIVGLTKLNVDKQSTAQNIDASSDDRTVAVSGQFDYVRSFDLHNVSATVLANGYQETEDGTYHTDCNANLGFRASYNYDHRYYLDFNSALVHSAKLAEGHRNVLSPSVTLGWNLAKESFLEGSVVNNLLISASASVLNNDMDLGYGDQKYYLYDGVWDKNGWGFTWHDGNNATCISPKRGENPELEMIKRKELSFGVKSAFLDNLITLDANFFTNSMEGYLIQSARNWPSHMEDFVPYQNNNNVKRVGFDFALGLNKKVGEVELSLGLTGTYFTSEFSKYEETNKYEYQNKQGRPQDAIFGYRCLGIFQSQDEINHSPKQNLGTDVKPGDLRYKDVNKDGVVDENDKVYLGVGGLLGSPFTGGLNFTAKWNGFTLFIAGSAQFGSKAMFSNSLAYSTSDWTCINSQRDSYYWMGNTSKYSAIARECWTAENPNAKYPRLTTGSTANNYCISDFWLYDFNVFSLDKVQLTYDLPASLFKEDGLVKSLSTYVSGAGLLTIAKEREYIEMNAGGAPMARFYNIGLKATF